MKVKKTILLIVSLSLFFASFGQKVNLKQADKLYEDLAYIKTSEILLDVAEKGYKSAELFEKLGNSFYFNNKMEEATKWYGELMALNKDVDPEYYFRYAQALKFTENYAEANKWMEKFISASSSDLRARSYASKRNYLESIEKVSREIPVTNMSLNSELSDFGSNQYKDVFLFSSNRESGRLYEWNEQPFLDLYSAKKTEEGTYGNVIKFDNLINTKYHESSISFLPTDQIAYFTRNNYYKKRLKKDDTGLNRLQIYRAHLQKDGSWGEITSVHFNSKDYSCAHPSVNSNGTKLYFASDKPGTIGNSDIYVVDILEDGKLGEPENLGSLINTEAQESFPYINSKGDLYYSSTGLNGLGGFDVYVVRDFENKYKNGAPYIVENLGKPINSAQDDFGYYENLGTKEGFFTSNRPGGKGDDDIYSFTVPDCTQEVEGVVYNIDTKEIIPGATVTLYNKSAEKIEEMVVGDDAKYHFTGLPCESVFLVRGEKEDYSSDEKRFETTDNPNEFIKIDLELKQEKILIEPCDDLAKVLDIPIIHFDFDKYNIRPDAEIELQKVLAVLNKYPTMHIDIRSHTDCRGSYKYNETLSENRAQSTKQYLINKGIASERLTAKGYGEYRLVNDCACEPHNDSKCSEAEHQENRRSEFIITSINGKKCNE
ncbi:OmpA family protein [Sabulilitoribacter arenilitoris]|uniref:OmpA family protein n=1 Tax=Wocania arenilitoris TaxID=2044858 RepID=A0AAE3JMS3_9FLAO|nr:OmpA family protein [Wocania arenilitoris]MCF7569634.1 OmpA family protein [Wocania arenilitoris]